MTERIKENERIFPAKLPLLISKPTAPPPSLPPTLLGKPGLPPPPIPNIPGSSLQEDNDKIAKDLNKYTPEVSLNSSSGGGLSPEESKTPSIKMKPVKITPFKALLSSSAPKAQVKKRNKKSIADIFNEDSQSEEEDMPPEAKMRMRNIGKDTPVPSGPNSFNKTKLGFCNSARIFEKNLEAVASTSDDVSKRSAKPAVKGIWNNNFKRLD